MRKITNIIWDTDGDKKLQKSLPKEVDVPKELGLYEIADYLSDEYGFCVFDFSCDLDNEN
jgi:hypothetical protein